MHHKKSGSKHIKGRSAFNKPWKVAGTKTESAAGEKFSDHKRRKAASDEISHADLTTDQSDAEEKSRD